MNPNGAGVLASGPLTSPGEPTVFPAIVKMLNKNLDWTNSLGVAFANQENDVMAQIQFLRHHDVAWAWGPAWPIVPAFWGWHGVNWGTGGGIYVKGGGYKG